jgi:hypothetical protein
MGRELASANARKPFWVFLQARQELIKGTAGSVGSVEAWANIAVSDIWALSRSAPAPHSLDHFRQHCVALLAFQPIQKRL